MKYLVLAALTLAGPLHADEPPTHSLRVVNDTSAAINQLFVVGDRSGTLRGKVSGIFGAPQDERDRLDAKLLPPGGSIALSLKGARCHYDIRAVLVDGRTFIGDDIDICANPRWALSMGARQ